MNKLSSQQTADAHAEIVQGILAAADAASELACFLRDGPDPHLATAVFESTWWRLPPFRRLDIPSLVAPHYEALGREDAAVFLSALAVQAEPAAERVVSAYRRIHAGLHARGCTIGAEIAGSRLGALFGESDPPSTKAAPSPGVDIASVDRIVLAASPQTQLRVALDILDRDRNFAGVVSLIEAVLFRIPIVAEYWVYHHLARAARELRNREDLAFLAASVAVQLWPWNEAARMPYATLLNAFRGTQRHRDAADVLRAHARFCPGRPLLEGAPADALLRLSPISGSAEIRQRSNRIVFPGETRPASNWPIYGPFVPPSLVSLRTELERPAVTVSELADAELLICNDSVATLDADGRAHGDLSFNGVPELIEHRLRDLEAVGHPVSNGALDHAVLIGDRHPPPNLCHFLLDHATRLFIYGAVGGTLDGTTVIGPGLRAGFQHDLVARLGVSDYRGTDTLARVRVRRLSVSSNCNALMHPAHLAAPWALQGLRGLFDLDRPRSRRILISRADARARRIANAADVEALLGRHGFEPVVPGTLALDQQAVLFAEATHVVGPHGAGLTNILFCAPGTHVLEIFHPLYGTSAFAALQDTLGLRYASMVGRDALSDAATDNLPDGSRERTPNWAGRDIRVDLDELRRWLGDIGA